MTERLHISRLLTLVGCAVVLGVGCGADDEGEPIPQQSAQDLQGQLSSIQGRLATGACPDVVEGDDTNVQKVSGIIDGLPSEVDSDVRDALRESFERLFELVEQECAAEETETTPTQTQTPPTETETIETETAPTVPTETEQPEDEKPGKGPKQDKQEGEGGNDGGGVVAPEGE
jgi:hypothetical protein